MGSQPISTAVHKSPNKLKFRAVVFDSQSRKRFKYNEKGHKDVIFQSLT
jgi:hypothetical protein